MFTFAFSEHRVCHRCRYETPAISSEAAFFLAKTEEGIDAWYNESAHTTRALKVELATSLRLSGSPLPNWAVLGPTSATTIGLSTTFTVSMAQLETSAVRMRRMLALDGLLDREFE